MLVELSAKGLLGVSNLRYGLGWNGELAVAQRAYTHDGCSRKPLGDSEVACCHDPLRFEP